MHTVLVAGATGSLGREVAKALHEKGHRVKTFSRNPARSRALGTESRMRSQPAIRPTLRASRASWTAWTRSSRASALLCASRWATAAAPSAKEGARHGDSDRRRSPQGDERRRVEIDEQGELVGQRTFAANRKGVRTLERWAKKRFPERRWAVEGVGGGIGRPLAQKLLAAGERVVDVPPKLSSRVRVLSTGNSRKNDALDATFTALAALRNDRLASVQPEDGPEGHAEILRLLTERREDLVCERTRALRTASTYFCGISSPILSGINSLPMPPPNCCVAPGPSTQLDGSAGVWPLRWCEMCALLIGG
jgi:hypothetical protein